MAEWREACLNPDIELPRGRIVPELPRGFRKLRHKLCQRPGQHIGALPAARERQVSPMAPAFPAHMVDEDLLPESLDEWLQWTAGPDVEIDVQEGGLVFAIHSSHC